MKYRVGVRAACRRFHLHVLAPVSCGPGTWQAERGGGSWKHGRREGCVGPLRPFAGLIARRSEAQVPGQRPTAAREDRRG